MFINTDSNETPVAKENETAKRSWSRRNLYEAKIVQNIGRFWVLRQAVAQLVAGGVSLAEIGVISPYAAQVSLLTSLMKDLTNPYKRRES